MPSRRGVALALLLSGAAPALGAVPTPAKTGPTPIKTAPTPIKAAPTPIKTAPAPVTPAPTPSGPALADALCNPAVAAPRPASFAATKLSQRHVGLSTRAYETGHYDVAAREMQMAYALTPRPDILFNLAQACREGAHEREALALYERVSASKAEPAVREAAQRHVRELRAQLARPEAELAQRLFDTRSYIAAAAAWESAYQVNPTPIYLFRAAQARRLAGQADEALLAYETFLKEDPHSELRKEAEEQLGRLRAQKDDARGAQHLHERRYAEAAAAWRSAYHQDPAPIYLFRLGQALRLQGKASDAQEALQAYERFVREDPRNELRGETEGYIRRLAALVQDQRAEQAEAARRYEDAAQAWEVAYGRDPAPGRLYRLGEARRLAGRKAAALAALQDFVRAAPGDPRRGAAQERIAALRGQVDAERRADERRRHPIYQRWWFWTALGAAAAGVTAGVVVGTVGRNDLLSGVPTGNQREVKP